MNIKASEMRESLFTYLKELSSRDIQKKQWIQSGRSDAFWAHFAYVIDYLFDYLDLESDPSNQIGYTLFDQEEVKALKKVIDAIKKVKQKIGYEKTDQEYLDSPYWEAVIQEAQRAYSLLQKNNADLSGK